MLSQNTNPQSFQVTISPPFTLPNPSSATNHENAPPSDKTHLIICSERATIARIEKPIVEFDHLIGLDKPKSDLRNYLIMPFLISQRTKIAQSYGTRGILLYGPPGGGKTSLAQACAHEMNANFFIVQGKDFYTEIKNTHKFIKDLFLAARQSQPACIVLENVDCMFSTKIEDTEQIRRTKTEFLVQMMNAYADPQTFVIGTSTNPWILPSAVRRRFPMRIPIFPPEKLDRIKFFTEKLLPIEHSLKTEDLAIIADLTEGYSYQNMVELIRLVNYEPVRELQKGKYFKQINKENHQYEACDSTDSEAQEMSFLDIPYEIIKPRKITIDDFLKVLKRTSASIEPIQMQQYQIFFEEFNEG